MWRIGNQRRLAAGQHLSPFLGQRKHRCSRARGSETRDSEGNGRWGGRHEGCGETGVVAARLLGTN